MKRLVVIVFLAAAVLTGLAIKTDQAMRRKRLAIAAAVCWAIVVIGFLV
jgi:hypothetical protein